MSVARKKVKNNLINLRATPEQKNLIQQAADLLGVSTAAFMLENSLKAARKELGAIEELRLSHRDAELFLAALENPQSPHPALVHAFQNYDKIFRK